MAEFKGRILLYFAVFYFELLDIRFHKKRDLHKTGNDAWKDSNFFIDENERRPTQEQPN